METAPEKALEQAEGSDERKAALEQAAHRYWRLWLENWTPPVTTHVSPPTPEAEAPTHPSHKAQDSASP